jgi:superfamily II DNA/RNA helicase
VAPRASSEAKSELADLQRFVQLAQSVERDSKATKLVEALPTAFKLAQEKGAARKAVLFTESVKTQEYLFKLLTESGYAGEIVLMNGSNNDETSKRTYAEWKARNAHRWEDVSSGSKSADMKAAIVDEFRERGTLLLATESAAEGVNLQFCSIVINYDLPWNPQRIEQRIGRCHRYGQKTDVLVVNFLNRKNEADKRVFELLDQKFNLFKGVFGASDEVLGAVESGVDLEMRIAVHLPELPHAGADQGSLRRPPTRARRQRSRRASTPRAAPSSRTSTPRSTTACASTRTQAKQSLGRPAAAHAPRPREVQPRRPRHLRRERATLPREARGRGLRRSASTSIGSAPRRWATPSSASTTRSRTT